jgi:DNA processing protein
MAVPGDVDQELSAGPLALLRAGASLAATVEDVLGLLGLEPGTQAELPLLDVPPEVRGLMAALSTAPRHADELALAAGLPAGTALAGLLRLELAGLAEQRPGLRFRRRAG